MRSTNNTFAIDRPIAINVSGTPTLEDQLQPPDLVTVSQEQELHKQSWAWVICSASNSPHDKLDCFINEPTGRS